jgi:hypothetical protein
MPVTAVTMLQEGVFTVQFRVDRLSCQATQLTPKPESAMVANILIALSPPLAAYVWTHIFLLAGGTDFNTSFLYCMGVMSVILVPVGLYHGRISILLGGLFWLFVVWNVLYEPFAVFF